MDIVRLSYALLVACFHERPSPMRIGLWVWDVYRIGDLGLLFAAAPAMHWTGSGEFGTIFESPNAIPSTGTFGLLLLPAVASKSALAPFSNWLPRAVQGPTLASRRAGFGREPGTVRAGSDRWTRDGAPWVAVPARPDGHRMLHNLRQVEAAIGSHLPRSGLAWESLLSHGLRSRM